MQNKKKLNHSIILEMLSKITACLYADSKDAVTWKGIHHG